MDNIAIIPARGGSKRIPHKNSKKFHGKPIILYAIETIKKSNLFKKIVVSSDDDKIKELVENDSSVDFIKRSPHLSCDVTPTSKVIRHVLHDQIGNSESLYTFCCCVYPCTPLLKVNHLETAYKKLNKGLFNYVYPILEYSYPIQRALKRDNQGVMSFINRDVEKTPSQSFEKRYHDAGQFYFGKVTSWINEESIYAGYGMRHSNNDFIDIDNIDDWKLAEKLFILEHQKL